MSAADQVGELYRRHAGAWAAARGTGLRERSWIDRFAGLLAPATTVLDVGCGPGEPIAGHLVRQGHLVTGVDASPEMIELFRASLPGQAAVVADMRSLQLGRQFGGIIAWDSFFHLPPRDQRLMFPVFRVHALPGAPLLFTSGSAAGESIGALEGEPLYHASLGPGEYRQLLDAHDFEVVAHVPDDPACDGHTVWLARRHP